VEVGLIKELRCLIEVGSITVITGYTYCITDQWGG